jgi:hypothetical protein
LKYIPPVDAAGRVIRRINTENLPSHLFRVPPCPPELTSFRFPSPHNPFKPLNLSDHIPSNI